MEEGSVRAHGVKHGQMSGMGNLQPSRTQRPSLGYESRSIPYCLASALLPMC